MKHIGYFFTISKVDKFVVMDFCYRKKKRKRNQKKL